MLLLLLRRATAESQIFLDYNENGEGFFVTLWGYIWLLSNSIYSFRFKITYKTIFKKNNKIYFILQYVISMFIYNVKIENVYIVL